jgi:hypothetical protein
MDEVLMLRGTVGPCHACGDDRILLPVDDDGFEFCCTDCDAAVLLVQLSVTLVADERLAG